MRVCPFLEEIIQSQLSQSFLCRCLVSNTPRFLIALYILWEHHASRPVVLPSPKVPLGTFVRCEEGMGENTIMDAF